MPMKALALHLINKHGNNLVEIKSKFDEWETGDWNVSHATADSLVGGNIYLHRGQKISSHIGGKVLSYRTLSNSRKVFRFQADPKLTNVTVLSGWGNEKKIVWQGNAMEIPSEDGESSFGEGAEAYRMHHARERDPKLARRAKQKRLAETGALKCEVCNFDFSEEFGDLGAGYIEAHHTTPVSQLAGTRRTKLSELALVCANCHRMLHRSNPLLDVPGMRVLRSGEV
ncbi:MAG: HNH endonuclease [Acidovorax sp.]|nr:HNH endonuclease [Acidovorax sp.]